MSDSPATKIGGQVNCRTTGSNDDCAGPTLFLLHGMQCYAVSFAVLKVFTGISNQLTGFDAKVPPLNY